jgi:hypothetical protein
MDAPAQDLSNMAGTSRSPKCGAGVAGSEAENERAVARLRRSDLAAPGIHRRRCGMGFQYAVELDAGDDRNTLRGTPSSPSRPRGRTSGGHIATARRCERALRFAHEPTRLRATRQADLRRHALGAGGRSRGRVVDRFRGVTTIDPAVAHRLGGDLSKTAQRRRAEAAVVDLLRSDEAWAKAA